MSAHTEHCQLDSELTLHVSEAPPKEARTQSPLTVRAVSLSLIKQDDEVIECRITFKVSPQLYQRIETEALFNLKPEVRRPLTAGNFLPELDIEIEIGLQPNLLPQPIEQAADANEAATYILNLSGEQPDNPLLSTESWLALSVKQQQESGETGYRTLWADMTASAFVEAATSGSGDQINNALASFFKESIEANLPAATQSATSQIVEEMTNYFKQVADTILDGLANVPSMFQEELEAALKSTSTDGQFFEEIVNFFKEDDWLFVQIEGESLLQIVFQGENEKWTCYAQARVEQEQFVFYSVCPVNAPESKRLAIAEFLTRANYDMIIGNFEMNFEDGEIRYKTSIDVEGDSLSSALIKQLVYANVMMMDTYLPGIMSVIYDDVSPKDALFQIELTQPSNEKQQDDQFDTVNPSSQTDVRQLQKQLFRESHVLSWLTPEEIAKFQQAMQMQQPYQRQQAQAIIEQLKSNIVKRESNLGEEMFDRAYNLFANVTLSGKIIKLIQRYSRLAAQTRSLLQGLSRGSDRNGQTPVNSHSLPASIELEKLFWSIDSRLHQLATGEVEDTQEIALLIEIEQIREQLLLYEQSIK